MLIITSHVPAIAAASRRAVKAAALTVQLYGGRLEDCSIGSGGLPPTCLYDPTARLLLIPTCADRPLLIEEAEDLVRTAQQDALIVRLSTWPGARHIVTFDLLARHHWDVEARSCCLPCIGHDARRLWLVPARHGDPHMVIESEGLRNCGDPQTLNSEETEAGIRRAADFYQRRIWGGL